MYTFLYKHILRGKMDPFVLLAIKLLNLLNLEGSYLNLRNLNLAKVVTTNIKPAVTTVESHFQARAATGSC